MSLRDTLNYATNNSFPVTTTDSTAQQARDEVWTQGQRADSPVHRHGTETGESMSDETKLHDTARVQLVCYLENITNRARIYESAFKMVLEANPERRDELNALLDAATRAPLTQSDRANIEELQRLVQYVHWETNKIPEAR
jgi:hypothetical protein